MIRFASVGSEMLNESHLWVINYDSYQWLSLIVWKALIISLCSTICNICHMCNIFNPVFWSYYNTNWAITWHIVTILLRSYCSKVLQNSWMVFTVQGATLFSNVSKQVLVQGNSRSFDLFQIGTKLSLSQACLSWYQRSSWLWVIIYESMNLIWYACDTNSHDKNILKVDQQRITCIFGWSDFVCHIA